MDIWRTILIRLVELTNAGESSEATTIITAKIKKMPYLLNKLEICVTHLLPLFGLVSGNDSRIFHNTPFLCSQTHPRSHLENLFLGCFSARKLTYLVAFVHDHDSITHPKNFR